MGGLKRLLHFAAKAKKKLSYYYSGVSEGACFIEASRQPPCVYRWGLKKWNSVRFGAMRRTIIPQAARIEEERQESVRQMVLEAQVRRFFLYVPLG